MVQKEIDIILKTIADMSGVETLQKGLSKTNLAISRRDVSQLSTLSGEFAKFGGKVTPVLNEFTKEITGLKFVRKGLIENLNLANTAEGTNNLNKSIDRIKNNISKPTKDLANLKHDFDGLTQKVGFASKGIMTFNKNTGKFEENSTLMIRMRKQAEDLGGTFTQSGHILKTNLNKKGWMEVMIPQAEIYNKQLKEIGTITNPIKRQREMNSVMNTAINRNRKFTDSMELMNIKNKELKKANAERSKQMQEDMKANKKQFSMEYLGVMFFGMGIMNTFMRMSTVATESFMKITQGQGAAAAAMTGFAASVELVKFSLGNAIATALIPMIPKIIELSNSISDLINNNSGLTSNILVWGALFGGLLFISGQLVIGIEALINVLGGTKLLNAIGGVRAALEKPLGTIMIAYGVGDAFADIMEGKFDPLGALKNAVTAGLGMKLLSGSTKAAWKLGWVTLIFQTAVEAVLDPKGFGIFIANLTNNLLRVLEMVNTLMNGFREGLIYYMTFGKAGKSPKDTFKKLSKDWLGDYYAGWEETLIKAKSENKLSSTLDFLIGDKLSFRKSQLDSAKVKAAEAANMYSSGFIENIQNSALQGNKGEMFLPPTLNIPVDDLNKFGAMTLPDNLIIPIQNANSNLDKLKENLNLLSTDTITKTTTPALESLNKDYVIPLNSNIYTTAENTYLFDASMIDSTNSIKNTAEPFSKLITNTFDTLNNMRSLTQATDAQTAALDKLTASIIKNNEAKAGKTSGGSSKSSDNVWTVSKSYFK